MFKTQVLLIKFSIFEVYICFSFYNYGFESIFLRKHVNYDRLLAKT
jgi:hypothetical protein